jgi:hypothetical protein
MYPEGFEGLEEAEQQPRRQYVSGSHQEVERLLRENERLKKSLEKEKFFNKLLDQEIQELKTNNPGSTQYPSDYWSGNRKVSKGAFYSLLVVTLVMAAYIGYGIYYKKQFNYLTFGGTHKPTPQVTATPAEPSADQTTYSNSSNEQPKNTILNNSDAPGAKATTESTTPLPPAKDSVPTIIGSKQNLTGSKQADEKEKQKAQVAAPGAEDEYNEEEVNKVLSEPVRSVTRPQRVTAERQATSQQAASEPEPNRPVIARYRITSKANFYNAPDENAMRGTFISESLNRTVDALEEKNGFIYVVYTNDLGFTSKGWLSKKDLTKE